MNNHSWFTIHLCTIEHSINRYWMHKYCLLSWESIPYLILWNYVYFQHNLELICLLPSCLKCKRASIYPCLSFLSPLTVQILSGISLHLPLFFPFHSCLFSRSSSPELRPLQASMSMRRDSQKYMLLLSYPPDVSPVWHKYSPSSPFFCLH